MFDVILFTLSVSAGGRDSHKVAGYKSELLTVCRTPGGVFHDVECRVSQWRALSFTN